MKKIAVHNVHKFALIAMSLLVSACSTPGYMQGPSDGMTEFKFVTARAPWSTAYEINVDPPKGTWMRIGTRKNFVSENKIGEEIYQTYIPLRKTINFHAGFIAGNRHCHVWFSFYLDEAREYQMMTNMWDGCRVGVFYKENDKLIPVKLGDTVKD